MIRALTAYCIVHGKPYKAQKRGQNPLSPEEAGLLLAAAVIGVSGTEIAKALKTSPSTITKYKRRPPNKWFYEYRGQMLLSEGNALIKEAGELISKASRM